MNAIAKFGRFWYDFIVGDDWTIAVAVVVLVALTSGLVHAGVNAWPLVPVGVAATLVASVRRAARAARDDRSAPPASDGGSPP